jgi:hypothetical protein
MKYLRKFNEELKPETYINAAKGLKRLGHGNRANELEKWSNDVKAREIDLKKKETIDKYSKFGVFRINISGDIGNFYIRLTNLLSDNEDNFDYWSNNSSEGESNFWHIFSFDLIPVDDYSFNLLKSNGFYINDYGVAGGMSIHHVAISKPGETPFSNGEWDLDAKGIKNTFYVDTEEIDLYFENRVEAIKYKNLLADLFEGKIEMGESSDKPGGIKEDMIDFYCNRKGADIDLFDDIAKNIRTMSVNKLYKD